MKVKLFISKHLIPFKIIAAVIAFAMIAGLLWFANDLLGNPVSYSLAKNSAEKYVAENYADDGYAVEGVGYSFKFGWYIAHVARPGSEDSRFSVIIGSNGDIGWDNYESLVLKGGNIRGRMDMSYRELADSVFESSAYPYSSDITFGELIFKGDEEKEMIHDFGLSTDILVPDALFDITELGAKGGLLTIYVDVEEATPEKAAEILLEINSLMERGGVPFYAIDLRLESPDGEYYSLDNFHRSDIYEDGLVERVKDNHQKTEAYYAELDSKPKPC